MNFKNVLVLSPHTDDAELGAGGTIARFIEEGANVHYVAFSAPQDELAAECTRALKMLRSEKNGANISILKFERRKFHENRQAILQYLYDLNVENSPDLVLTPCRVDVHQDHETITREVVRCFKNSSIFGYILRWNCIEIKEDVIISIEERHLKAKLGALAQYFSQRERSYFDSKYHRNEAYVRGLGFPSHLAEAFEMIRLVVPSRKAFEMIRPGIPSRI